MPTEIVMPKLGLTMSHGTVGKWFKRQGEAIALGEPLLEVTTDKINYEVESPASGVLREIVAREGEEHACGAVIAVIAGAGEAPGLEPSVVVNGKHSARAVEPSRAGPVHARPRALGRIVASPAARRLARDRGLPLESIEGTGPRGRITLSDVAGVAASPPAAAPPTTVPASRRAIFRKMSEVAQLPLAQVSTVVRVDVLRALLARRGDAGWTAVAVYACAHALRDDPALRIDASTGAPFEAIDIGVAADTPHGLIVPVVRDAARRTLAEIQCEIVRLADAARSGALAGSDVGGACFSISNVGPQRVERVQPLVDPPQTAILGIGAATQRPAVVDGAVVPAWMLDLVVSFDHRFVDGAPAARFLATVAAGLADPGLLL